MRQFAVVLLVTATLGSSAVAARTPESDPMTAAPPIGYYTFQKVVYQNDGGYPDDRAYFERLLRNINAHLSATNSNVEIRVVSFGAGIKLFQMARSEPQLASEIDGLKAKHVTFLVCRNTLRAMNLKPEDLFGVEAADIVPSGVAELARLQGQGFVYLHP